ncbi:26S proteasome non-ATPase regulatory subunit 4-like [Amphibalanus amphitrite]|uniref:26S proteasome non-ATPase regulatory subunit 4-like n=1 Tax=Amphibalanus amphitrite TaxID=1232801 RepID=UPI001C90D116|nr:26S proteasome non-ATPase regulatory subunit 4-like [Amphibalanus amphitrite]
MVLESTMICIDNSDYMRNGDFVPSRIQAQQDAVGMVCHAKTRSNPENNCGLITSAGGQVLTTLTTDAGRILSKLHEVTPNGESNFLSSLRIAHLALKHRQSKNHKTRIIFFVGSPIDCDEKEVIKVAKRLKKEKVNVDIVSFGEEAANTNLLSQFINTINGKDGTGSHLVTVPTGPHLSDALVSSPILQGEDGAGAPGIGGGSGFEFGVDPNEDPELALALRVSMDEQRALQQQQESREPAPAAGTGGAAGAAPAGRPAAAAGSEEAMLEQALAMSMGGGGGTPAAPDFASMTEEEQIAYAMQMSMADQAAEETPTPMETDQGEEKKKGDDDDYLEVVSDPAFLQSVLENLPGVDPQSEDVRRAMGNIARQQPPPKEDDKDKQK